MGAVTGMKIISLLVGICFIAQSMAKVELVVFVSLSMPRHVLVKLSKNVKKVDGVVALRGWANTKGKLIRSQIQQLLQLTRCGFIFRPDLFRELNIKHVPTFALIEFDSLTRVRSFDKILGNVTLDYALKEFMQRGEHQKVAAIKLAKLRGEGA